MKSLRRISMLYALCSMLLLAAAPQAAFAQTNVPNVNIMEYGAWNTPENKDLVIRLPQEDLARFSAEFRANVMDSAGQLKKDFVPIEAKIGRATIGALSSVAKIINNSLGGFVSILLIVLFAFWVMMESYQVATSGGDVKKLGYEIALKAVWIIVWFVILNSDPVYWFMMIAGPIIRAGTIVSDTILNAVTGAAGVSLPDTCGAIREYMAAHPMADAKNAIIASESVADLLCVPTRLSGFFYTCVAAGLQWMWQGFGSSALTFIAGVAFVWIFVKNIWDFAIEAFGVITSLFLVIMLLPFTAVAECFDGGTNLKDQGLFSKFFGMLAGMLGGNKLKLHSQFMVFIRAAIYYVALSIVAGIGMALLGMVAQPGFLQNAPVIENSGDFILILAVGALVAHLAKKAGDITKDLGGAIDGEFGKQVYADAAATWKKLSGGAQGWWKAFRGK
ncbi:MAG: hypothetical protein FWG39_03225 [Alphaproteobacteria bacterium]|nr:hypothetical protein [Alphaproteobacteria bacterium]